MELEKISLITEDNITENGNIDVKKTVDIVNFLIKRNNEIVDFLKSLSNIVGSMAKGLSNMEQRKKMIRQRLMGNLNKIAVSQEHPLAQLLNQTYKKEEE